MPAAAGALKETAANLVPQSISPRKGEYLLKSKFIKNSLLMTATLLITRTAGVLYNIYISGKIGAEGIGVLQLTMTVYAFAATFATSGVTLAVTRITADLAAAGDFSSVKRVVRRCTAAALLLSCAAGTLLLVFAKEIGTLFLGDARTVLSLKVLAFSLPFMAVSASLRGYFIAVRDIIKSSGEQLVEQLTEIIICTCLLAAFAEKGLSCACCAVAFSIVLSEIVSCFYSVIMFVLSVRKHKESASPAKQKGFLKKLISIGLPVTGSSCLRSGLSMIENALIPSGLQKYGLSNTQALEEYGVITGMALPVLMFPSVLLNSVSTLLVPEMSEAGSENRTQRISAMARRVLKYTFMFVIPVTAFFLTFADKLGTLLYGREDVGMYIRILALTVPFLYLDNVVDGMLKGLNQQLHYFAYNMIDSAIRVLLALFLIPAMGIRAVIIIMFVSAILNSTLSTYRLITVANIEIDFWRWIVKPAALSAAASLAVSAVL